MRRKLFTVILPCLNEDATILNRVKSIKKSLDKSKYKNDYEILICDNGSTDGSKKIYEKNKIDFIVEEKHGYGNAIIAGVDKANTKYIVMLDGDMSYRSDDIAIFVDELEKGNDIVVGNRFRGKIEKKAMPLSHKIGSRFLTFYANLLFRTRMHDFHCGLRAFDREKVEKLDLSSAGFEFASEMIIKAKRKKLKLKEIETDLSKDGRKRKSHLRTFRDGFRHLHLINKEKFKSSKLFRYFSTFFMAIALLFSFTTLSCLIPHDLVHDNAVESIKQLSEKFYGKDSREPKNGKYEKHGDARNYAMIFATNPSHPIKSAIEMKCNIYCVNAGDDCIDALVNNKKTNMNYSRYWQGQSTTIHFFTIFFNVNTLTFISTIIFAILLIYTEIKLFKKDKILAISYFLGLLSINVSFMTQSLQFIPIMYVVLIGTNLVIRMREKGSKKFDVLFLLLGIATCYFDFLTAETLSITVPLLVYVYLEIKEKNKVPMKQIICWSLLWLIGYAGAFAAKWLLVYLDEGVPGLRAIYANMFGHKTNLGFFQSMLVTTARNITYLAPLCYVNGNMLFLAAVVSGFCLIYNVIFERKFLALYLICFIPVLRFAIITGHSYFLGYFAYRALLCYAILVSITILKALKRLFIHPKLDT